jgi:hypothetical protein
LLFVSGALYVSLGSLRVVIAENAAGQRVRYLIVAACLAVDYDGVVALACLIAYSVFSISPLIYVPLGPKPGMSV